jgi:hypothetical protein
MGPRVLDASGAVQIGLMSAVVGAATLPAICGGEATACPVPRNAPHREAAEVIPASTTTAPRRGFLIDSRIPLSTLESIGGHGHTFRRKSRRVGGPG